MVSTFFHKLVPYDQTWNIEGGEYFNTAFCNILTWKRYYCPRGWHRKIPWPSLPGLQAFPDLRGLTRTQPNIAVPPLFGNNLIEERKAWTFEHEFICIICVVFSSCNVSLLKFDIFTLPIPSSFRESELHQVLTSVQWFCIEHISIKDPVLSSSPVHDDMRELVLPKCWWLPCWRFHPCQKTRIYCFWRSMQKGDYENNITLY